MGYTCPFCFSTHELKDCPMKCSFITRTGVCPDGIPCDESGYVGKAFYNKCLKCTRARKDFYCPISVESESGFPLVVPMRCIQTKSLPIALIGPKASGKSNYIGVLVDQIRKKMTISFDCSIIMNCDATSKQLYDDNYARPLFKEKMQITATDSGKTPPMIFPIDFNSGKHVTLTIYDTAGENFDSSEAMDSFNDYLANAKGLIVLIDPLQLPLVREKINGRIPLPEENTNINDVLDMVIAKIDSKYTKPVKVFDMSLAIVFTKIDALEALNDEDFPLQSLTEDSTYVDRGMFVQSDFNMAQEDVHTLLDNYLGDESNQLQSNLKRFKNYAYFGVSALGGIPNSDGSLAGNKVEPRRVLDPLLWILSQNGFIKTAKK